MINVGFCIHCGAALLPGQRRDAIFCCANCRMAHHRAVHAGSDAVIDVLRAQDPSIEVIRRYPGDVAVAAAKAEAAKPPESAWLREKAARAQRAEFPALMHLALSGKREQPAPEPPEVSEAQRRENAVIAKFENAGPTERAAMISAAANRKGIVRPPRSNK